MDEKIKNGEQPYESTTLTAGADVESESVVESNGSPLGKFKDVKSLMGAYNSLQSEFTKKCQQLSELEKSKNSDNTHSVPFFETQNWQTSLNEFFDKNPQAKQFSKEIALAIVDDKDLQNSTSPLTSAYAKILEKNYENLSNAINNDDFIIKKLSKEAKQNLVDGYLKEISTAPFLMPANSGNSVASENKMPASFSEAGEIAKKLFK